MSVTHGLLLAKITAQSLPGILVSLAECTDTLFHQPLATNYTPAAHGPVACRPHNQMAMVLSG
jgi:hypothetical protein